MKSILFVLSLMIFAINANAQTQQSPPEKIFTYVDRMPSFPGDYNALSTYLNTNLRYPEVAKQRGTQGRVYIRFIVRANGSITDIELIRGIGDGCDEEALRLVKNMPKWRPGTSNGRDVDVRYNLPITFKLD